MGICTELCAFQPYYFSHINSGSFHTGPFIFVFVFSSAVERDPPPFTYDLALNENLVSFADVWMPVPLSCKASSSRVAQVCTGHTRGCLAFMGSVSHSLVWHIHTGILLEGIVKGFGSIPPALSYIKVQTATLLMPFVGPLTFEGVGPLPRSAWENNRCLIVLARLLSG